MKTALFVVAFGLSFCYSQGTAHAASEPTSCGPAQETFDVNVSKGQHSAPQVDAGKSLIYIFQDDTQFQYLPRPTTRIGVDGKWVGATHSSSYAYAAVDPGEHHVCVQWQNIGIRGNQAALHFNAEPGKSYYFRVKDTLIHGGKKEIELSPMDSDEGQLLATKFGLSSSRPKK